MILNLFSYPSNFGAIKLYKCDYYGAKLSLPRSALVEKFTASVEQKNYTDQLLFGGNGQPNYYSLSNRKINLSMTFLFANSITGSLDPALDLLLNVSAYAFQGTNVSYKFTKNNNTDLENTTPVNEELLYKFLFQNPETSTNNYLYYQVDENGLHTKLDSFPDPFPPSGWIEVFIYGTSVNPFELYREPMFRIDSSEGSFFPCIVDRISFAMQEDYIKLNCEVLCLNMDSSTRFDFINSGQYINNNISVIPLHKSRIKITNYNNQLSTDFLITNPELFDYMNGLFTQSFNNIPITEFSFSYENNIQTVYTNRQKEVLRTYATGFYSQSRKVSGTMSVLALRSSQPTFNRYPMLNNRTSTSCVLNFGNQKLTMPYMLWQPGKIQANQNQYVDLQFNWALVSRDRQGEPLFDMEV